MSLYHILQETVNKPQFSKWKTADMFLLRCNVLLEYQKVNGYFVIVLFFSANRSKDLVTELITKY